MKQFEIFICCLILMISLFAFGVGVKHHQRTKASAQAEDMVIETGDWSMIAHSAVAHGNDLVMTVQENITYVYEPKPDITAHEVALILPAFILADKGYLSHLENLPPEAKRHFRREPPEKEDK